jgi:hypothetical protein
MPEIDAQTTEIATHQRRARAARARPQPGDKRYGRSAVTNGSVLLHGIPQTSPWVRRCRDLINLHIADLGGEENCSVAERNLVRRAAVMSVELEALEARFATAGGATPDQLDLYGRTAGNLRRILESVGLKRRSKPIDGLTLSDLVRLDDADRRAKAAAAKAVVDEASS